MREDEGEVEVTAGEGPFQVRAVPPIEEGAPLRPFTLPDWNSANKGVAASSQSQGRVSLARGGWSFVESVSSVWLVRKR